MCELEWNRALLTMAMISSADISMPTFEPQEDILNIHGDKIGQNEMQTMHIQCTTHICDHCSSPEVQ